MRTQLTATSYPSALRWFFHAITLLALSAFAYSPMALAFDVYPEFHSMTENEQASIESAALIDSEYQSDFVTYLTPLDWDRDYLLAPRALDVSFGSLSNKHFMERTRAHFNTPLLASAGLHFRFTFFNERDREQNQTHAIFEMVKRIAPGISVSIYGEPSYYKRENDLGAALLLHLRPDHELRLFHTWVDLTRESNNDRNDYFVKGSEPRTIGLVGRCGSCLGENSWLEYFVRWQNPTVWRFPSQAFEYSSSNEAAGVSASVIEAKARLHARLQLSHWNEGNDPLDASSQVARERIDHKRLEALLSSEIPANGYQFEYGVGWFHRRWLTGEGRNLEHRNLIPSIWFHFDRDKTQGRPPDRLSLGYEFTAFSASGDTDSVNIAASELKPWAIEHRANLRYEFMFENNAALGLTVSADLDAAVRGSGGLFEGGHGWFRAFF